MAFQPKFKVTTGQLTSLLYRLPQDIKKYATALSIHKKLIMITYAI